MSASDKAQMAASLRSVRAILENNIPGLSDADIEALLWDYYFDVDKTVNYLIKKNTPKEPATAKKGRTTIHPQCVFGAA